MNIRLIILIIGVFLFTIGFVNGYKPKVEKKHIYNILPRNLYDDVFFSLPSSEYDNEIYDSINPTYILNDEKNYGSLYNKPVKRCDNTVSEGCKINYHQHIPDNSNFKTIYDDNFRLFNQEITDNYKL
jgi:hypothetical protein